MSADVEALALLIHARGGTTTAPLRPDRCGVCRESLASAHTILASDWLAERIAAAQAEMAGRFRIAAELTVQDVRAQRGDHIAGLVEDSFAAHFDRAAEYRIPPASTEEADRA